MEEELERTRGGNRRPINPAPAQMEMPSELKEGPRRTRRSRLGNTAMVDYEVPQKYIHPEWDYQWWTIKVLNQEVDNSEYVTISEGGWEPVRPTEMPDMVPRGVERTSNTIDRRGLRLYKRPMYLTEEARAEDYKIALAQKQDKLAQAMATPSDSAPRVGAKLDLSIGPALKG